MPVLSFSHVSKSFHRHAGQMLLRDRLARLCAAAGAPQAELLADELFLLAEGARVSRQSVGPEGPAARFVRMAEATIARHLCAAA